MYFRHLINGVNIVDKGRRHRDFPLYSNEPLWNLICFGSYLSAVTSTNVKGLYVSACHLCRLYKVHTPHRLALQHYFVKGL